MRDCMEQEYGKDHPWTGFDKWHAFHHVSGKIKLPCQYPLRCLWRYLRKTDQILTQDGETNRAELFKN